MPEGDEEGDRMGSVVPDLVEEAEGFLRFSDVVVGDLSPSPPARTPAGALDARSPRAQNEPPVPHRGAAFSGAVDPPFAPTARQQLAAAFSVDCATQAARRGQQEREKKK
nr:unnamed protein product [Digitaria exilis]